MKKEAIPVPSIPSFFEIQGDSSPVPGYNPDKERKTLQPLSVFPLKRKKISGSHCSFYCSKRMLRQAHPPAHLFLYQFPGKSSGLSFFIMPFFTCFCLFQVPFPLLSANPYMVTNWSLSKIYLFPFPFPL